LSRPLRFVPEVAVLGTGSVQASRRISNAALRPMVSNYDESSGDFGAWVERVTHIQSRSFCGEGETTASMGLRAGLLAVEDAGLKPKEVDFVLLCSFTMDEIYPGDSVDIAKEFGPKCGSITLSGGCAGSVYGLGMALSMVKGGFARNVLVVGSEHISACMNMADPLTAILFGDGAGAAVVGRRENPEPETGFLDRVALRHDFSPKNIHMGNANLALPGRLLGPSERSRTGAAVEQQYIVMGGGARVLRNAVAAMADVTVEMLGYGPEDLKNEDAGLRAALERIHLVPHQANGRIVDGVQQRLGLHEDRVYRTLYHTGNMSAATNVYTLDYARREGNLKRRERPDGTGEVTPCGRKLRKGDLVIMTSIGAGYIYGAVGFRL
jgi:3-oxoacyl-[acyl-carrier-protein] synthase III